MSQLRLAVVRGALTRGTQVPVGELTTLVTRGAGSLDSYFARYLPQLVLAVVVPLIAGAAILTQDLLAAAIVALTLPLIPLFMVLIGRYTEARVDRQWATLGVLSGHFLDVVAGLPTLKIFNRARAQAQMLRSIGERYRAATMGVLRMSFLSSLVLELLATLSVAVIAVAIGLRLVERLAGPADRADRADPRPRGVPARCAWSGCTSTPPPTGSPPPGAWWTSSTSTLPRAGRRRSTWPARPSACAT